VHPDRGPLHSSAAGRGRGQAIAVHAVWCTGRVAAIFHRVISIVIPVKNGGEGLIRCLDGIRDQKTSEPVQIVVVDSGSTDVSVEVARDRGALIYQIPAHEFTHGAARNLGASLADGEILVFISQDAYPVDDQWLTRLTSPLRSDPTVVGVYGRQLAHDGATPPEMYFLNFLYGASPRRQRASSVDELSMNTTLFSNVNAAILRNIWERFPFVEDIVMSEDQEWSRRVLLEGFTIVYEPAAAVRHSHNYTLSGAFRRFFDSGASAGRAYLAGGQHSSRVLRQAAIEYVRGELGWLWRTGQWQWIPYAAAYESTKMLGLLLGAKHERIPLGVKRRLSATASHWE
jgi:glycosyltransferase involved in cell wall biosynthesis